jgi:hypothetical protein
LSNLELDDFILSKLATLDGTDRCAAPVAVPPPRLHLFADAHGLDFLVRTGTMRAMHSRVSPHASTILYGVTFVERWLAQRIARLSSGCRAAVERLSSGPEYMFCSLLASRLNPRGSHLDFFVVRLFQGDVDAWLAGPQAAYAVGLRCATLSCKHPGQSGDAAMMLQPAFYEVAVQQRMIENIYVRFAD